MSAASLTTVAHVPGFILKLSLDREPAFIRTCARRWLAHGSITNARTQPATVSVCALPSERGVIAALSSLGSVNWRTAIERTQTHALAVRRFLPARRDILPGICNFLGTLSARSSSLFPFVHDANQSANGLVNGLFLSPNYLSWLPLHVPNMQQKDARNHEQCTREYE